MFTWGRSMAAGLVSWVGRVALAWLLLCSAGSLHAAYDLDRLGVPRFVDRSYIDLSKVVQLSRFRSSAGHDYSDDRERCRSMKHYFIAPDATATIVSPVAGTVTTLRADFVGTQVVISADLYPDFSFILFHVALARPLVVGERVALGQVLGTHVGRQTWSDIAVGVNTPGGYRLVSYFETLTDAGFAPFQARGIARPADLVISRAERDAAPYQCQGQTFVNLAVPADTELVNLSVEQPITGTAQVMGPITAQSILLVANPPAVTLGMLGSVFVGAVLPPALGGGIYFFSPSLGWLPFTGCDKVPAAFQGGLFASMGLSAVAAPADLSSLRGTVLYVGYGLGSTVQNACAHMMRTASFAPVYTLQ